MRRNLAYSSAVTNSDPNNLIRLILMGVPASGDTEQGPVIPSFASVLRDAKGAAPGWSGVSESTSSIRGDIAAASIGK
jgi:hypothetical protein